ncbi:MAG: BatA domain-containing protein [Gemmatimonadota bacterium]|nr:BatA domain-containing protein [Gemmatimonadota bacterium]
MTFLSPAFLWGASLAAIGIIALHFLVTKQPRASVLPTARFVPDSPATATARDARPSDLLLMLLRVIVVLAAGAALAKPIMKPGREPLRRIFVVDVSRSVASGKEAADSVTALHRDGDLVVAFDSAARVLGPGVRDSLAVTRTTDARGNLSAALIASLRAASDLRDKADSIELMIVSPLLAEEHDAATDSIRKLWPGRARIIRVAARVDSPSIAPGMSAGISADAGATDPLAVSVSLASRTRAPLSARIVRSATMSAEDSAWIASGDRALVLWPPSQRPLHAIARVPPDLSGGVLSREARVVSAFQRRWIFPADSVRGTRVIARWADGQPAAVEKKMGGGCLRSVAIPVPVAGDLVIRPEFVQLVAAIAAPCGDKGLPTLLGASVVASLAGSGTLATGSAFEAREDVASPLAPWLFGIALAAAIGELVARKFNRHGAVADAAIANRAARRAPAIGASA